MKVDEGASWQKHPTWAGFVKCYECNWSKEEGREDLRWGGHHPECRFREPATECLGEA